MIELPLKTIEDFEEFFDRRLAAYVAEVRRFLEDDGFDGRDVEEYSELARVLRKSYYDAEMARIVACAKELGGEIPRIKPCEYSRRA